MTNELWAEVDAIPGSYTRLSAEKLYGVAFGQKAIVEVGVDQGRSARVLMAAMGDRGELDLVDSWESCLVDNYLKVEKLVEEKRRRGTQVLIHRKSSEQVAKELRYMKWDVVHIDANHYAPYPAQDCELWLPKLKVGGVACFHDYGASFDAVTEAVDTYTAGWEDLGVWDGLAIRRKSA